MYGRDKLEFHLDAKPWHGGIEMHARTICGASGVARMAQPILFTERNEGEMLGPPMLTMHRDEAQALMDELWHCGLRPSEGSGSAGALAATQRHLADMQKIAFGALKLPEVAK